MSKEFLLKPNGTTEYHANEYEDITKFDERYIYRAEDGKPHKFAFCTCCGLKVFWTLPKKEGGDHFFRHVSGYYTETERSRMLSCNNYKPSKGVTGNPQMITNDFLDEIIVFLKENSFWIYKYINKILLNKGYITHRFYIECIQNIFIDNVNGLTTAHKLSERTLPYNILALMNDLKGNITYQKIQGKSVNFNKYIKDNKINGYNYIRFSLYKEYSERNLMGIEAICSFNHFTKQEIDPPETKHVETIKMDKAIFFKFIEQQKKYEYKYTLSDKQIMNSKFQYKDSIIKDKAIYKEINETLNSLFHE